MGLYQEPGESDGETAIKSILKKMRIKFVQEKNIYGLTGDSRSHRRADFYLPKYDTYIEYFGMWGDKEHRQRYREKMRVYKKNNISCLYLFEKDVPRRIRKKVEAHIKTRQPICSITKKSIKKPKELIEEEPEEKGSNKTIVIITGIAIIIIFLIFSLAPSDITDSNDAICEEVLEIEFQNVYFKDANQKIEPSIRIEIYDYPNGKFKVHNDTDYDLSMDISYKYYVLGGHPTIISGKVRHEREKEKTVDISKRTFVKIETLHGVDFGNDEQFNGFKMKLECKESSKE